MFLGFVLLASLYRDVPRLCVVNHSLLKCSKTRYIIVHMNTFVKFIARIVHLPFIYLPFMPFLLFLPNYLKSVTIVFVILWSRGLFMVNLVTAATLEFERHTYVYIHTVWRIYSAIKSPPIDILKWTIYDPVIYLTAGKVDPFPRHVCIYINLYIGSEPSSRD